jgi:hypothetical protein
VSAAAIRQVLQRVRAGIPETFSGDDLKAAELIWSELVDRFERESAALAPAPVPGAIYVVVASTGGMQTDADPKGGPIVMETEADGATLARANERAASLERSYGPCRVGRVVFEDEPGFTL